MEILIGNKKYLYISKFKNKYMYIFQFLNIMIEIHIEDIKYLNIWKF